MLGGLSSREQQRPSPQVYIYAHDQKLQTYKTF